MQLFSCSGLMSNVNHIVVMFKHSVKPKLTFGISFQIRLKKEQEEKEDKRRYKAQAHLFTIIKVRGYLVSASNSYLSLMTSPSVVLLFFIGNW